MLLMLQSLANFKKKLYVSLMFGRIKIFDVTIFYGGLENKRLNGLLYFDNRLLISLQAN